MSKTDNQLRRARLMVHAFEERIRRPNAELLQLAQAMSDDQWAKWGIEVCGFEYGPSSETQAMAIAMLQERADIDTRYDKLNHSNQKIWEAAR